jgi:hypothetical protein
MKKDEGRLSIAFLLLLASQVSLLPNHNAGWFVSSREQAAFQFSLHSRRLSPFSPFTAAIGEKTVILIRAPLVFTIIIVVLSANSFLLCLAFC